MHVPEGCKFSSARFALFQVLGKIARVIRAGFVVQITDQVFSAVANWSLFNVVHFLSFDHFKSLRFRISAGACAIAAGPYKAGSSPYSTARPTRLRFPETSTPRIPSLPQPAASRVVKHKLLGALRCFAPCFQPRAPAKHLPAK